MAQTRKLGMALLGTTLAAAVLMFSSDARVSAQDSGREDTVVKLAGKKLRLDRSGRLRPISSEEAREMVSTLTAMTARTEVRTVSASGGGTLVELAGFDHVLVGRPNEDGTVDVRCVSSVDEAVSFFGQQSAASTAKE
jgi:hypothetical protein